jgi:hypothetical protein
MPTLGDRLDTLEAALRSIVRQGVDAQVVLVTPAHKTAARLLGKRFDATVVDDPGRGLSAAMNAGLLLPGSESYYAWLNDDDLLRPHGLAVLRSLLEERPGSPLSYGACDYIDPDGRIIGTSRMGALAARVLPWGPDLIPMPATLTRLTCARNIGGYDESLKYAMDLDLLRRLQRTGPFASTRVSVAAFRWHADSLTVANRRASVAEAERVRRRYLPAPLASAAPLWNVPVRWATYAAAAEVNRRARRI